MKAAVIHKFGNVGDIEIAEIPTPEPKAHEVQIAVEAAGVNPVDWKIIEGFLKGGFDYQFPITLGWDVSGVVSKVGSDVTTLKEGERVHAYCWKGEFIQDGSFAEYFCLDANYVATFPESLTFAQAAAIPLSGLTAWQSLFDVGKLQKNQTVLIHAGAGGVGGYGIQFAKHAGAHVITTTSEPNFDYVRLLGADQVIDYRKENFADVILKDYPEGLDLVFDTVGEATLRESYRVVKPGGHLVSIAALVDIGVAERQGFHADFLFVHQDGEQLRHFSKLIEEGALKPPPIQEYPFEDVEDALLQCRTGHTQGKIVLKIGDRL